LPPQCGKKAQQTLSFSPGFNRVVPLFAFVLPNRFNGFAAARMETVETVPKCDDGAWPPG
jgi:hypothetical protein